VQTQLALADFVVDASTQYTLPETKERLPGPSCGWQLKWPMMKPKKYSYLQHKDRARWPSFGNFRKKNANRHIKLIDFWVKWTAK